MSASYNCPSFSPSNSMSGSHSLGGVGDGSSTYTPVDSVTSRPNTPGSNSGTMKSSTLERLGADGKPKAEPTKTQSLDRANDAVYTATTNVVKAIMWLSQGVEKAVAKDYLDLVRNVGVELRALLASVDLLAGIFPAHAHK